MPSLEDVFLKLAGENRAVKNNEFSFILNLFYFILFLEWKR